METETDTDLEASLASLSEHLSAAMQDGEGFALHLAAEQSSFIRLNRGKVRQPGTVRQLEAEIALYAGQKEAGATLTLTGDRREDRSRLSGAVERGRHILAGMEDDPHLLRPPENRDSDEGSLVEEPSSPAEMVEEVLAAADGADLVGLLTAGTIERGFACDRGQRNLFRSQSHVVDYSVYRGRDKAVKDLIAGERFEPEVVKAAIGSAVKRSEILTRPPRQLPPGSYRAFLTPSAVHELFALLNEGGFSQRQLKTRRSPLVRLHDGKARFDPAVAIACDLRGVAPTFSAEGWVRPERISLVKGGSAATALTSARTAAEFDLPPTGVDGGESPLSIVMEGGTLAEADAMEALGTGLYVSDLWYSNWSDRTAARLTGMTRFATVWVEDGQAVAPVSAARFDDSLYRMLGEHLEGITRERQQLVSTNTYGRRGLGAYLLPGLLLSRWDITL